MVNSIQRDLKRRKKVLKFETKRLQYKSIFKDFSFPQALRQNYLLKLNNLPRNSSEIRIKNRCILTGRGKSVHRFCKISRIKLRELAAGGFLMGITKSSW
jgi:ribosomal protein S14